MAEAKAEPRASTQVVTGENRAEFMAKKLDIKQVETLEKSVTEKKAEPTPEEKKALEADAEKKADAEAEEEEVKVKKQNPKLERRFSQLTTKRKEAEEATAKAKDEVKAERSAREKAEQEREALRLKYEPPPSADLGPEPQPDQYTDQKQFLSEHTKWAGHKALKERDDKEAGEKNRLAAEARIKSWDERQVAMRTKNPAYDSKIAASDVRVSAEVREVIISSERGPQILLHFAEHPEDAERIGKMTVGGAFIAIGKLEAKLEAEEGKTLKETTKQTDKTPIAEISKAPAPISPLRGSDAPADLPVNGKGEFTGSYEQFKELRRSGKLK